jgi:hypothetical protein
MKALNVIGAVVSLSISTAGCNNSETRRLQEQLRLQQAARTRICNNLEFAFSASALVAKEVQPTHGDLMRLDRDLAYFAPLIEGCVDLPTTTEHALELSLSQEPSKEALCQGIVDAARALSDAKRREWPVPGGIK